jgi:prepilin-type N-terminal cleavage/methylation domain-containing protein
MSRKSGFSLTEVMVTVAITGIIMTGVVMTFSRVNKSTTNSARKSAQTNTLRGVSEIFRHDFNSAGQGVGDLIAYNIRYSLNSALTGVGIDPDAKADPYFYGVADLDYEDKGSGDNFSTITLQWFDYDFTQGSASPTFFVSGYQWEDSGTYLGPIVLSSNNADDIAGLSEDDVLIFYKIRLLYEASTYEDFAIWNAGLKDASDNPENEAIILQVGSVTNSGVGGFTDVTEKATITIKGDGLFQNVFTSNKYLTKTEDVETELETRLDSVGHPPKWAFVARKLGTGDDYHRVKYSVDRGAGTDSWALIRYSNVGTVMVPEVIATGLSDFQIKLGLDVPVGTAPTSVVRDDIDGYVTASQTNVWTMMVGTNPSPLASWGAFSVDDFKIMIGRHALVADVMFTQELTDKTEKGVERTFQEQYRILNVNLPMPNL